MRYQTKEQIIDDVYLILNAPLSYETKFNAVKQLLLWGWTELNGKYIGCPYWSEGALEKYKDRYREANRSGNGLIHEHIIPRGILMEEIFNLSETDLTKEKLEEYFEKYVLATVVTKEEDQNLNRSKMPEEFKNTRDPWLRYKEAQIKVYKVEWKKTELLKKELICFENYENIVKSEETKEIEEVGDIQGNSNIEETKFSKGSASTNEILLRISTLIRENIPDIDITPLEEKGMYKFYMKGYNFVNFQLQKKKIQLWIHCKNNHHLKDLNNLIKRDTAKNHPVYKAELHTLEDTDDILKYILDAALMK